MGKAGDVIASDNSASGEVTEITAEAQPSLVDYIYYASRQRDAERDLDSAKPTLADKLQQLARQDFQEPCERAAASNEDIQTEGLTAAQTNYVRSWQTLRRATWLSAFFLCTTDILGPFNAPYAFRQNGYVAGTLLYVFMGGMAFYGGALMWWLFVKLDSDRFPVKSYSHLADRIIGSWLRVIVTFLIWIHMAVNIGTSSLGNAQSLYQLAGGHICFVVAIVVWIIVGIVLNQIRTLDKYSWFSSVAVTLNILVIFLSVGFVAHSLPNYASAKAAYGIPEGPVVKTLFSPFALFQRISGVMQIAYAYGGATIFAQITAEMRRPMEFFKAFCCAQALIFTIYVFYGLYVYSFQGQFTLPVAYQGVSRQQWQDVGNIMELIAGVIASGLYGNIGLKVMYVNVVEDHLHGPSLLSLRGRLLWTVIVVAFWALGFVIAAAIPQVQTLSSMIAAVANVQFTYSFPTGFAFVYLVRLHAETGGDMYSRGAPSFSDGWSSWSRWKRGLFGGSPFMVLFKWFNLIVSLCSLATSGLGIYGSALSIKNAFQTSAATSFGCAAPV